MGIKEKGFVGASANIYANNSATLNMLSLREKADLYNLLESLNIDKMPDEIVIIPTQEHFDLLAEAFEEYHNPS